MRNRALSPTILISTFAVLAGAGLAQPSTAAQISFVQSAQSRSQPPPQQGLPPEKKKSLSKYGPEDVFPGANEQEDNRGRATQSKANSTPAARPQSAFRRSSAGARSAVSPSTSPSGASSVTSMPAPASAPAPSAVTSQSPATAASRSTAVAPSPTIVVAASGDRPGQTIAPRQSSMLPFAAKWNAPILSIMALVVSAALVYVLAKLREKIREGSAG
jgi:hypothetical protein